jgi:hypothetical protein
MLLIKDDDQWWNVDKVRILKGYTGVCNGCVALFMEFYNLKEYVLIFCSRAALCTI